MSQNNLIAVGELVRVIGANTDSKRAFMEQELYVTSNTYSNSQPYLLGTEKNTTQTTGYSWYPEEVELVTENKSVSGFLALQMKLKIGDKVKIVFKPRKDQWEHLVGGEYAWQTANDGRMEQEGRVVKKSNDGRFRIRFEDKSSLTFPAISLQLLERAPSAESVILNDRYTGVVTTEGVVIDDGRRYDFKVFEQLGELIKEARVKGGLKNVGLASDEHGKPLFNKAIADAMDLKVGDTVKVELNLANVATLYGLREYTRRMSEWTGETSEIQAIDDEGYVTLRRDMVFPAMALSLVQRGNFTAKKLRLGYNWEAEVFPTHVQVGCQRYEFAAFEKLIQVIVKFKEFGEVEEEKESE